MYIAVVHILLFKFSFGYRNQTHFHIFQIEHFSAVKFVNSYEKNMSFYMISKSNN